MKVTGKSDVILPKRLEEAKDDSKDIPIIFSQLLSNKKMLSNSFIIENVSDSDSGKEIQSNHDQDRSLVFNDLEANEVKELKFVESEDEGEKNSNHTNNSKELDDNHSDKPDKKDPQLINNYENNTQELLDQNKNEISHTHSEEDKQEEKNKNEILDEDNKNKEEKPEEETKSDKLDEDKSKEEEKSEDKDKEEEKSEEKSEEDEKKNEKLDENKGEEETKIKDDENKEENLDKDENKEEEKSEEDEKKSDKIDEDKNKEKEKEKSEEESEEDEKKSEKSDEGKSKEEDEIKEDENKEEKLDKDEDKEEEKSKENSEDGEKKNEKLEEDKINEVEKSGEEKKKENIDEDNKNNEEEKSEEEEKKSEKSDEDKSKEEKSEEEEKKSEKLDEGKGKEEEKSEEKSEEEEKKSEKLDEDKSKEETKIKDDENKEEKLDKDENSEEKQSEDKKKEEKPESSESSDKSSDENEKKDESLNENKEIENKEIEEKNNNEKKINEEKREMESKEEEVEKENEKEEGKREEINPKKEKSESKISVDDFEEVRMEEFQKEEIKEEKNKNNDLKKSDIQSQDLKKSNKKIMDKESERSSQKNIGNSSVDILNSTSQQTFNHIEKELPKSKNFSKSIQDEFDSKPKKEEEGFINVEKDADISPRTSEVQSPNLDTNRVMNLFNKIINEDKIIENEEYYDIKEKGEIKDMIGSHKQYEIRFITKKGGLEIKCYRRYDNFFRFHQKIKAKYPYFIIPNLTPKNSMVKIFSISNEFYTNRRIQLIFYLNFIYLHPSLRRTTEFTKFVSDPNFDNNFFQVNSSDSNATNYSPSTSAMIKNKFFSVLNFLGSSNQTHKISDHEIQIKKLAIHYKNILEKFTSLRGSVFDYIKSIKTEGSEYKNLSETLYYLKDSFTSVENSDKILMGFYNECSKISDSNNLNYPSAMQIQIKLDALIELLLGTCECLENYCEFIKRYERIEQKKNSYEGNWENAAAIINEYDACTTLKDKYEKVLLVESQNYIKFYGDKINECLKEFKALLKEINTKILKE